MAHSIRRVVTGHNALGQSIFAMDGTPRLGVSPGSAGDHGAHFHEMVTAPALDRGCARHLRIHRTHTIDYAIVLDGEIHAMMTRANVYSGAGDVLIQRGTDHACSNRTDEPVRVALVLINARTAAAD